MLNKCNIYNLDPCVHIGKNMAAYINTAPLNSKITSVARAIFTGIFAAFSMLAQKHFYSISFGPILPISIGISFLTLFFGIMIWGSMTRQMNAMDASMSE